MTNSREKFEAWYENAEWKEPFSEFCYKAWLAGRESMRDEAANIAKFYAKNSATARHIVGAIQDIQP